MNLTGTLSKPKEPETQMTPMIDMVFLLLVFFIATVEFPRPESALPVFLPKNKARGGIRRPPQKPPPQLVITINGEGKSAVYSLENRKMSGISGLTSTLSIARRHFPDAEIVIDGSPKVEYRHIVNAINACVSVGYVNVSFARPRAS